MTDLAPEESAEGDSERFPDYTSQIEEMVRQCYGWRNGDVLGGYVILAALANPGKGGIVKLVCHPHSPSYVDRGIVEEGLDYLRGNAITLIPCEDDDE